MIYADYLVMFAVLLCISVNRHSTLILATFLLNEVAFYLTWSDFSFSVVSAIIFAAIAKSLPNVKYEIQLSFLAYSLLYWFSAVDFWLTEKETVFYVIFPYTIKLIDIYVIYHLINKEQRNVGIHSASHCTFN